VAALEGITLLGHGGTAGAIVELALVVGLVVIVLAVLVGQRKDRENR
jgi:hypothetical protein